MDEVCPVCGSEGYENIDGHYYCVECGTQSQHQREEIVEEPDAATVQQKIRTKKGRKRKADTLIETEECTESLHECWQILYRIFINHLIKKGFDLAIKESCKLVWFLYLDFVFRYQLQQFNRVDTMELSSHRLCQSMSNFKLIKLWRQNNRSVKPLEYWKSSKKRRLEVDEEVDKEWEETDSLIMYTQDKAKMAEAVYKEVAHVNHKRAYVSKRVLIGLLYVGLLYSGQFVLLSDFLKMLLSDDIPFYSWHQHIPQAMSRKLWKHQIDRIYDKNSPVTSADMGRMLVQLKGNIRLPALPLDQSIIIKCLLEKFYLPSSLKTPLYRLLYLCQSVSLTAVLEQPSSDNIYLDLSATVALIILLKLIYRLDDNYEMQQSSYRIDQMKIDRANSTYVWEDWVTMVTRKKYNNLQTSIELSLKDIPQLDDTSNYLDFLRKKCFDSYTAQTLSLTRPDLENQKGDWSLPINAIFSVYAKRKRQQRKTNTKQKQRPLFVLIGDQVKTVTNNNIVPRWIPLDLSLPGLGRACEQYCPIPTLTTYYNVPINKLNLPSSQQFLLTFAVEVINVPCKCLLKLLNLTEQHLAKDIDNVSSVIQMVRQSTNYDNDKNYEV